MAHSLKFLMIGKIVPRTAFGPATENEHWPDLVDHDGDLLLSSTISNDFAPIDGSEHAIDQDS